MYRNGLTFANILRCDNRGSLSFHVTSTKLPYFCEIVSVVIIEAVQFSRYFKKAALFLRKFQPVIIGAVQMFKSL